MSYLIVVAIFVLLALYFLHANRQSLRPLNPNVASKGDDSQVRRLREALEHVSDAVFVIEVQAGGKYRFESLNRAAFRMFGRDVEEGQELSPGIAGVPGAGGLCRLKANLDKAIESGRPVRYRETFVIAEDGGSRNCDIELIPMRDSSGYVLCYACDVTEPTLYEQELAQRLQLEERLKGFAASAPGFFFSWHHGPDGSHAMPFASEGIQDLFGLHPADVALSVSPINLLIHPEDAARYFCAVAQSVRDMLPFIVEFRVRHPQKGELWIESRSRPIAREDEGIVWYGFMHDISERKRMETALRTSLENLAEAQRIGQMGSWEMDLITGELTWSEEIFRMFEYDPDMSPPSCEAFLNVVHPEDQDAVKKECADSLASGQPCRIDHRLLFPDGQVKYVRESFETRYDQDGKALYTHGTVQDITTLKVVEQQLQDTQKKLRELVISRELLRENERKRIAWEMHEELGQLLAGMKMRLSGMRTRLAKEAPGVETECQPMNALIDQSIGLVRNIVSDLRPTVLLHGVVPSLEWLVAEFNKQPGMKCDLVVEEEDTESVNEELATLAFRIAQDALADAMRYPGVSAVSVSWRSNNDRQCLTIRHDGEAANGDLTGSHSLRVFGMQERISAFGGKTRISDQGGRGLVIEASFGECT